MIKQYNKLVRNNIPDIIKASGKKADYRPLTRPEYEQALKQKAVEEANELLKAETLQDIAEEAADLVEVLNALISHLGIYSDFVEIAEQKRREKGSFDCGYFLESVED